MRHASRVGRFGGEERCIRGFGAENCAKRDFGLGGRILLKWIAKKHDEVGGMN